MTETAAAARFGALKQVAAAAGGVDPRTARRHLERAGIEPDATGAYEIEAAAAEVLARVSPAHLLGHAAAQRGDVDPSKLAFAAHLTSSKRDLDDIRVARERLKLDRELKTVVSAADVDEAARALIGKLRANVMAIPKRIAARVVAEHATTHTAIVGISDEECRRALTDAADIGAIVRELIG